MAKLTPPPTNYLGYEFNSDTLEWVMVFSTSVSVAQLREYIQSYVKKHSKYGIDFLIVKEEIVLTPQTRVRFDVNESDLPVDIE
jgi:hypothetical protein